jgi:hypothetical protein
MKIPRWLFVALLVGALALGITGSTVLAHSESTDGDSPFQSFVSRVATILGLNETDVQEAFDQAGREMENDALHKFLDRQVELGRLTREQADEYEGWYQSRPEVLSPRPFFRRFGGHGFFGGRMWGRHGRLGGGLHQGVDPTPTPESSGANSS